MKILLVEDNLLNQKVVSFHLKKRNYHVECVTDWVEVMDIVKDGSPDIIFMDIMLPEKNGFEITREIREYEKSKGIEKGIPIIALTANTLDNDKDKCIKAGMNDYLAKPFTALDLYKVIDNILNQT
ncbi:MAG: response regulator [Actinomycetota bacterium]|nr:response regulator [Actinomycetota bacterium]